MLYSLLFRTPFPLSLSARMPSYSSFPPVYTHVYVCLCLYCPSLSLFPVYMCCNTLLFVPFPLSVCPNPLISPVCPLHLLPRLTVMPRAGHPAVSPRRLTDERLTQMSLGLTSFLRSQSHRGNAEPACEFHAKITQRISRRIGWD